MSAPKLPGNRCQCQGCGLLFTSVREFDRHRVGTYARPGEWRGLRRCLTQPELIERGWRPNAAGYWMKVRRNRAPAGLGAAIAAPVATPAEAERQRPEKATGAAKAGAAQ